MIENEVIHRLFAKPKIDYDAVLKYAMCKEATEEVKSLLDECIYEARLSFYYRVSYIVLPVQTKDNCVDLDFIKSSSKMLVKAMDGCDRCILFAATVGVGIDNLIRKYSRSAPAKALLFQALGTERVETLCKTFVKEIKKEMKIKTNRRVSPGYGDLPLGIQKDIFKLLNCSRTIGLTLNDNLLMTPSKSVTAFMGIKK